MELYKGIKAKDDVQSLIHLIEEQEQKGEEIRIHPNGFLQLKLTESKHWRSPGYRLHVWTDQIPPRRDIQFSVHDHIFDIESYVLLGALRNTTYSVQEDPQGEFVILRANTKGQLEAFDRKVQCNPHTVENVVEGDLYRIPQGEFHSSTPLTPFVTTVFNKINTNFSLAPQIIAPKGYDPKNLTTDRTIDQNKAWEVINLAKKKISETYLNV